MKRNTTEILLQLRQLMQHPIGTQEKPLAAYLVPSGDAHQSEYICAHDERRAFVTGFDGSAGTAVITYNNALLWTDGRYYQQALEQLDSNWTLMKDGLPSTPTIENWLSSNLPKDSIVGVDPKLLSYRSWKPISKELLDAGCKLWPVEHNLVDIVWGDKQPAQTKNEISTLELDFVGATVAEKWEVVKSHILKKAAYALIVTALDEIAWFLNLRGSDIDYNPVFFSYLIITLDKIIFFASTNKLPKNFNEHLNQNKIEVTVYDYESIRDHVLNIVKKTSKKIWISPCSSYYLTALIPKKQRLQEITPIALQKAIKNRVEVKGFIDCHIRDGIALCQYFAWLEMMVLKKQYVDELTGAEKLKSLRSGKKNFMGLSFETISSSGPNASIVHYRPNEKTNRQITECEMYLCDSGAQYKDGTTDVTRTFHFGEPTDFQKETYTRVLKGQLSFGATIFPAKIKGQMLDTIARKALWDIGLDYSHGTGHGIGHYLNVHEGPMGVGIRRMPDDPGLQENMIISNEPGYYEDGEFGIRIEDVVQVVPANSQHNFKDRGALTFKTITMCPKQTKLIKKELLSQKEVILLNEYHRQVWETLAPILREQNDILTLSWLEKETAKI